MVEVGDTTFVLPVPPPLQLYVLAPDAVRVVDEPLQIGLDDGLMETVGIVLMVAVTETLGVEVYP